ncbi:hypothetical protein B0T17DRAFT_543125 [Bombardia bombarda]|uniref:Uncharacterized protein n=1 Tax=Bombardia bombarda TaxID=252184 RepID=A0AA39TPD7_9PEZI|nr:hypothetical protein B0T17DRAFT_543125 [Bombardia bombarda]
MQSGLGSLAKQDGKGRRTADRPPPPPEDLYDTIAACSSQTQDLDPTERQTHS